MKVTPLLLLAVLTVSCNSLHKSEARQQAEIWLDNSFTKCGEDYFSNFSPPSEQVRVYVNKYGTDVNKALFEFKNLTLVFEDKPVTATEKLNGIEAKGTGFAQFTQFRYHDGTKWSSWDEIPLVFSGEVMKMLSNMIGRPNSPMYLAFEKGKEGWSGGSGYWQKVSCSELPAH